MASASTARRTQAQRRQATRAALLDASTAQLVECGIAGFTTTEVCKRAGVSQGALFKHFESKATLLAAVIEHLFGVLRDDYERAFVELGDDADLRHGVDLLWSRMFDPRLWAGFELYTAARTDAELASALQPVVEEHYARIHELAAGLLAGIDATVRTSLVDLIIFAIQGLAVNQMANPNAEQIDRLRDTLDVVIAATLDDISTVHPGGPRAE